MAAPLLNGPRGAVLAGGIGAVVIGVMASGRPQPEVARRLPRPPAIVPSASASATASAGAQGSPAAPPARALPPAPPNADPPRFADPYEATTFQKGNIHTHTTWSDGDHPPQDVYRWYRDRGYNFLAITDHNNLTDPAIFRLLEQKKKFIMITGEEVTMWGAGKQVHVNALCHKRTIGGKKLNTQREALAWGVAQVKAQDGVALVNHPNWDWALSPSDIPAARGAALLEIWSGHPFVHTLGDETHPSHEALWDMMLAEGETFAAAALDDAHQYSPRAPDTAARPGRAWVFTYAPELTRKAVCQALGEGKLYASSGATLKRISVKDDVFSVSPGESGADVEFIGWGGVVLQTGKAGDDGAAHYKLKGGEGYVRARVTVDGEKRAWTQAARLAR